MDETLAYFAGFVASDGHLARKKLSIEISVEDIEILNLFKLAFPKASIRTRARTVVLNGHIYKNYKTAVFELCDVKFIKELSSIFSIPIGKKSAIIKFPILTEEYERHFMRGVIDGDGSIGVTKAKRPFISLITTSKDFASGYCDFIHRKLGIQKTTSPNKRDNAYNIMITSDNAQQLVRLLYENSIISLPRKFDKAKNIISWIRPYGRKVAHPKRWSKYDDDVVLNHTNTESTLILNRTLKSIKIRRWRLNLLQSKSLSMNVLS